MKELENLTYLCQCPETLRELAGDVRQSADKMKQKMPQSTEGILLLPPLHRRPLKTTSTRRLVQAARRVRKRPLSDPTISELPEQPRKKRKLCYSKRVGMKADRMRQRGKSLQQKIPSGSENESIMNVCDQGTEGTPTSTSYHKTNQMVTEKVGVLGNAASSTIFPASRVTTAQSDKRSSIDFIRQASNILVNSTCGLRKQQQIHRIAHSYSFKQLKAAKQPTLTADIENQFEQLHETEIDGARRFEIRELRKQQDEKDQSAVRKQGNNRHYSNSSVKILSLCSQRLKVQETCKPLLQLLNVSLH